MTRIAAAGSFFAGDKQSDGQYDGSVKYETGYSVAVKPGFFGIASSDGIYDVEYHTDEDDKHTKSNSDHKYCIQSSDQRDIHHLVHRLQPYGLEYIFKTKETAVHKSEKTENTPAQLMIPARSILLGLIKEKSDREKYNVPVLRLRTLRRR